jgi:hypothetical protein
MAVTFLAVRRGLWSALSNLLIKPMIIPFKTGVRERLWEKNCVAIGLSGGFIEPLESTALNLIYRSMDFLLRFFPDTDCDPTLAAAYNRRMNVDYEEIRDFIVLHDATTQRDDTPFCKACAAVELPESLKARLDLFRASGVLRRWGGRHVPRPQLAVGDGGHGHPAKAVPAAGRSRALFGHGTADGQVRADAGRLRAHPADPRRLPARPLSG